MALNRAQRGILIVLALALLAGCAAPKYPVYGCLATRTERGVPGMPCAPLDDVQEK